MDLELSQQRHEAHLLIDVLPKDKLQAVRILLDVLVEPLSKSLAMAPMDDEELTPEAITAIERGELDFQQGRTTSHADMLREFGG